MVGIVVVLVAATVGGVLVRTGRSDQGERALFFSVATRSSTGGFMGASFIVLFGSGTFEGDSADAKGIFSIHTALPPTAANTRASGTWEADRVVSFVSFGVVNPRAEGGLLVMMVTLNFDDGTVLQGVTLAQTCHIGNPPPGTAEGVTLSGPLTFDIPLAGITTFGEPPE